MSCSPTPNGERPRSADAGFRHQTQNLASDSTIGVDNKLGIPRARSRIYSFGTTATTGAALDEGGEGHLEAMLRATALDAKRRRRANHTFSAAAAVGDAATATMPRRGKKQHGDKNERGTSSTECMVGGARNRGADAGCTTANVQTADVQDDADTDTGTHLGAIDISKVSNIGKSAEQKMPDATDTNWRTRPACGGVLLGTRYGYPFQKSTKYTPISPWESCMCF